MAVTEGTSQSGIAELEEMFAASAVRAGQRRRAKAAAVLGAIGALWALVRPMLLTLGAGASFVTAGFLVSPILGLVVLGLVFVSLDWLQSGEDSR
jgi:hypothetical protein